MKKMSHWKTGAKVLAGVAGLLALVLATILAVGGIKWITASFRGEVDARERTEASGTFRLATYEEFFDLCADVQSKESAIRNLEEEAESASEQRQATIAQSITALRNVRAESINTYNSKAAQEHRESFVDANLPARLDVNIEETTCAM
jgi:hypothetical protein